MAVLRDPIKNSIMYNSHPYTTCMVSLSVYKIKLLFLVLSVNLYSRIAQSVDYA